MTQFRIQGKKEIRVSFGSFLVENDEIEIVSKEKFKKIREDYEKFLNSLESKTLTLFQLALRKRKKMKTDPKIIITLETFFSEISKIEANEKEEMKSFFTPILKQKQIDITPDFFDDTRVWRRLKKAHEEAYIPFALEEANKRSKTRMTIAQFEMGLQEVGGWKEWEQFLHPFASPEDFSKQKEVFYKNIKDYAELKLIWESDRKAIKEFFVRRESAFPLLVNNYDKEIQFTESTSSFEFDMDHPLVMITEADSKRKKHLIKYKFFQLFEFSLLFSAFFPWCFSHFGFNENSINYGQLLYGILSFSAFFYAFDFFNKRRRITKMIENNLTLSHLSSVVMYLICVMDIRLGGVLRGSINQSDIQLIEEQFNYLVIIYSVLILVRMVGNRSLKLHPVTALIFLFIYFEKINDLHRKDREGKDTHWNRARLKELIGIFSKILQIISNISKSYYNCIIGNTEEICDAFAQGFIPSKENKNKALEFLENDQIKKYFLTNIKPLEQHTHTYSIKDWRHSRKSKILEPSEEDLFIKFFDEIISIIQKALDITLKVRPYNWIPKLKAFFGNVSQWYLIPITLGVITSLLHIV